MLGLFFAFSKKHSASKRKKRRKKKNDQKSQLEKKKKFIEFRTKKRLLPHPATMADPVSPVATSKKSKRLGARGWIWVVFGVLQVNA